jgi:hypothetical protein
VGVLIVQVDDFLVHWFLRLGFLNQYTAFKISSQCTGLPEAKKLKL